MKMYILLTIIALQTVLSYSQEKEDQSLMSRNAIGVQYTGYNAAKKPLAWYGVTYSRQLLSGNNGYYLSPHIGLGVYDFGRPGPFLKLGVSAMTGRNWLYGGVEIDGFYNGVVKSLGTSFTLGPKFLILKRVLIEPSVGFIYGQPEDYLNYSVQPSHSLRTSFWF